MTPTRNLLRLLGVLGLLLGTASCSSPTLRGETLQPRLARLDTRAGETIRGEKLLERPAVIAFYAARKGQPAWNLDAGAASIREAIEGMAKDGLDPADYHRARIDSLIALRTSRRSDEVDADLEILLSDAVAGMIDHARFGRVLPSSLDKRWNVDLRKDAPPLHEAMARVAQASSPAGGVEKEKIDHFIYHELRDELGLLQKIAQAGGWRAIPAGRAVLPGGRDPRLTLVRARLAATGELSADRVGGSDSTTYDKDLVAAVKLFQDRHRLDSDAKLDASTLAAMNVPIDQRIAQVRVNLERSRWALPGLTGGDFLLVNLPAYKAYLVRDGKPVWETRTQIGKEGRQTPTFRSMMKFAIFNPTWTVPKTILAEDVLGGIARGEDMLAKKHLKVYDAEEQEVDPKSIDWKDATSDNFPYTLRQDAGPANALGRVKFMFPNPYDIYLHDTPSRELFDAEKRAFSSGCIRLEDPLGLAEQLLGDKGYDRARIDSTIAAGETRQVNLTTPLPVMIVYWTVSVSIQGEVRYAPDVYELDPPLLAALRARPRVAARAE